MRCLPSLRSVSCFFILVLHFCTVVSCLCPSDTQCVPKCCPESDIMTPRGCAPGQGDGLDIPAEILILPRKPDCSEMYYLVPGIDQYELLYNGTLLREEEEPTQNFCLEENLLNQTFIYVCFPTDDETVENEKKIQFYSVGLFISLPFILATFLVYAFINDKIFRTLHAKCVKFHSLCLFLSYFLLGLVQNDLTLDDAPCVLLGYAIQFFFMATFFWLNVMCFDIYWAFSGLRNLTGSVKERERKKLIVYSIYAWCTPLLILVITVAVDLSPSVPINSFFKPRVGEDKCFFKEKGATWIYFYLPMALIILSNIILFGVTAFRIWSHRREAAVLKRGDSRKHDSTNDKESLVIMEYDEDQLYLPWYSGPKTSTEQYLFTLYLKLFIVMGINWVMELLSSLAGGPSYLWYIPDFTNTLQGLFIFLIFVWKKRVRRLVWNKIRSCCGKETISSGPRTTWSGASSRNTNSTHSTGTVNNSIKMNPATQPSQTSLA